MAQPLDLLPSTRLACCGLMRLMRAVAWVACGLIGVSTARADALEDARRLAAAGQAVQAVRVLESALLARPADPELRFARAVLLSDQGRTEEAMSAFLKLSEEWPELPDPINNLAVLHAAKGELQRARELLESALRNHPQHHIARENLGDVYLRLALLQWQQVATATMPDPRLARKLQLAQTLANQLPTP